MADTSPQSGSQKHPQKKPSKRFILFFTLAAALLVIPLTVRMTQTSTDTRSKASQEKNYAEGAILVKLKDKNAPVSKTEMIVKTKHGKRVNKRIPKINVDVVEVTPGDEEEAIAALKADPNVAFAELNYEFYPDTYIPNDAHFGDQFGLHNTGQFGGTTDADIDAAEAWDTTRGLRPDGEAVRIAILDSGIDEDHPDLAGKIVASANHLTSLPPNHTNPDGIETTNDENGHGTAVAGVAAASTNNAQGIAGTCPDCTLLNGKIARDDSLITTNVWMASGIRWAADNGAKAINVSFGGMTQHPQTTQEAINYARSKGAVVVFSAGNNATSTLHYPASMEGAIAVAAVNNKDTITTFSNYGSWVDVAAPGLDIRTTKNNGEYGWYWGTSFAAPHVAGTAALIWARNPNASLESVERQLLESSDRIAGTGDKWVHGRVNAHRAVTPILPIATVTPTPLPSGATTPTPTLNQNPTSAVTPTTTTSRKKKKKKRKKKKGYIMTPKTHAVLRNNQNSHAISIA